MIPPQNTIDFLDDMIKHSGVNNTKSEFKNLYLQAKLKLSNIPDFDIERKKRYNTFLINYENALLYIIRYKRELILKQVISV